MTTRVTLALLVFCAAGALAAQKLPPVTDTPAWKSAVVLELKGRFSEAFHQYHQVLLSKDFGGDSSPGAGELRVHLLTKLANLAFQLGWLEESWDLTTQLSALGSAAKAAEALRKHLRQPDSATSPLPWFRPDRYSQLAGPRMTTSVVPYSRLQLGAFRDWKRARTQLDILLEQGWLPFVEDRKVGKERLVAVFVVSHRTVEDLKRLRAQGFDPTTLPVDP